MLSFVHLWSLGTGREGGQRGGSFEAPNSAPTTDNSCIYSERERNKEKESKEREAEKESEREGGRERESGG
jgi:hypothetical protein